RRPARLPGTDRGPRLPDRHVRPLTNVPFTTTESRLTGQHGIGRTQARSGGQVSFFVRFRGTRVMEDNPYAVGAAIGPPTEEGFARPRWQRILTVLGLSKVAEALFELLLFVGTFGFTAAFNPRVIADWQDDRQVQVFLIQRLVALPAIAVLSLW